MKFNQSINLYFLNGIDFGYCGKNKEIQNKFHYNKNFDSSYETCLSFINKISDISYEVFANQFNFTECNGITLCFTDAYDCYWNKAFQKEHINHYFILEPSLNHCIIIDPFCDIDNLIIENKMLPKIQSYVKIYLNKTEIDKISFKDIIYDLSTRKHIYNGIESFAEDIKNIASIDELVNDNMKNIETSLMIRRLDRIINYRYNSYLYMKQLGDIESLLVLNSYNQWNKIRSLFIRLFISKKASLLEHLAQNIKEIAITEKKLIEHFSILTGR